LTETASVTSPVKPALAISWSTPATAGSGVAMTASSAVATASRTVFATSQRSFAGASAAAVRAIARVAGSVS
jgi:hypothetical protein